MTPDAYTEFTERLRERLSRRDRVVGLVALGSMAAADYVPDQWSDHDFFVVVEPGAQAAFRSDLSWLPGHEQIALAFAETEHGVKVLYDDGHLLEFAVFDDAELSLAKVNRYRVLVGQGDLERRMAEVRTETVRSAETGRRDDLWLLGQFVTNLLVGVGRYRRGERLSGNAYVRSHALSHLLVLVARHVPAERAALLDDLDATRRFDMVYPEIGREIDAALCEPVPVAAARLLDLARRELGGRVADFPGRAFDVVEAYVREGPSRIL